MRKIGDVLTHWPLAIAILPICCLLISYNIEMPYDRWLSVNLSFELAIASFVVFGVCFLFLAWPNRPQWINCLAVGGISLVALLSKQSHTKAPVADLIITLSFVVLYILLKSYFRQRETEEK